MNRRLKLFQMYCEEKGWKYLVEKTCSNNMYKLEIIFPSSDSITASSVDMDQALDIIKKKLQEKLNNKGK